MKEEREKKQAVALSYHTENDRAPKIVAKGKGYVADELIKEALKHNVPIQEDASLVGLLSQLEINEAIPEQLYDVVAEIFAFVYRIDKNS
ncbi:EscU/YscU/HrcU family type III secretion system export apparatus switch protein [Anaerobacillus isosaccharinicus]|uniref:EscU/YscU/HrcU family type III secretion system export apparatus switch protein n=1 Tax=Anaerobacillus isosaccharinicus TaxID=1532552 RepID=A0A1S2L7Z4_9BACI|nr:EscU/YscU/HrcU family type III secretion system export apparatus switch protein [Anaerobacillus isosaccharinicus]MBA5587355.1 EscU/YscU/HrcU family type III secretion system export apparatus switch protein [Anaerobacillus isosaccharinicus]QOY34452.1 EscU/YscU/HrcU family type III secretion system export apparatus switch protein [Anaerobacillus isosaccharinicus]